MITSSRIVKHESRVVKLNPLYIRQVPTTHLKVNMFKCYVWYHFAILLLSLKGSTFVTKKYAFYSSPKALFILDISYFGTLDSKISWRYQMPEYETRNTEQLGNLASLSDTIKDKF